jgi:ADP-ribose pyrophosphatase
MTQERKLTSRSVYRGRILNLRVDEVELQGGTKTLREVIENPGAAGVVAIDEQDRLLMVRQYRYPKGEFLLELPAGKIDPGETPEICAQRELEEETGFSCPKLKPFAVIYPAAAYLTESVHLFWADALFPAHQNLDEDERISIEWLKFDKALALVLSGEIKDAKSQIGILKAALLRQCPVLMP